MITVVIPVYNGEKTIEETIQSVLKQTYQDLEIIVIDDGSKDATLDVVNRIKDIRIKVFSYPNTGLPVSRNRGLKLAQGKYISFLDADDLWTPDKLESQLNALENNPEAAVAYSWTNYIDESSKFLRSSSYITVNGYALPELLTINFFNNGSNGLFLTETLKDLGGFDESLKHSADWDMYLRLAAKYHFVCVPKPQILYRVLTSSLSTNIRNMENYSLKVIEKAFSQAPEDLQSLKIQSLENLYIYLALKSLEGITGVQKSFLALKLLGKILTYQPYIAWKRRKLISIIILKSLLGIVFPNQKAKSFWNYLRYINKE